MNAIWGFLLALFLALTGEYLAGVLAPALGLQKGAISGIMMAILLGIPSITCSSCPNSCGRASSSP